MNWISIAGYTAAFCTTISFLPQAVKTIKTKDTSGISLYMYVIFTTGTILWFLYGLFTNNLPVLIANAITAVLSIVILFYKIKFR